jgi:hypothetical protein
LISVIAALVILCLPLRKQRLGNENQPYFSWVALLVLEWVRIIVTSGSRAYLLFKIRLLKLQIIRLPLYNTLFSLGFYHGQCIVYLV